MSTDANMFLNNHSPKPFPRQAPELPDGLPRDPIPIDPFPAPAAPEDLHVGPAHVVLLSDRGPVRFTDNSHDLVPQPQSSSVTALLHRIAGAAKYPVTWLSPSTAGTDGDAMRRGLFHDLASRFGYSPQVVLIDEQEYERFYYDAGVNIIWSAWHGIEDEVPVRYDTERPLASLASYTYVNQQMVGQLTKIAPPNAVVAVQDYQFMLVPAMARALRPDLRVVHFNHTPFPSLTSFVRLPVAISSTLVHGMLGADLLGFQRTQWAYRFLNCCRWLGLEVDQERGYVRHRGRRTWVRCYPVSVDVDPLTVRSKAPAVSRWAANTVASDRALTIARVDRLDPAKNALRGFEAYSLLLCRRPTLARTVRFVACLVPSRERVPEYQRYATRVRRVIDDVNRYHPGSITVHYGNDSDRALGVLRGYDLLLVNPITDGMNLVAQEGPVVNTKDGAVVLSRGAGSADVLSGAVILDRPRDVVATANAMEAALFLTPAERRDRARRMRAAISGTGAGEWLDRQLADVQAVRGGSAPSSPPAYPTTEVPSAFPAGEAPSW